jgi:hypothetical protein
VHLSDHDIGAMLHGETSEPAFTEHAAICAECAHKIRSARAAERITRERLAFLDHSVPAISARAVMLPQQTTRYLPLKQMAAAATFLLLAFGAAAALPASPFHRMLVRAMAGLTSHDASAPAQPIRAAAQRDAGRHPDTNSGVLFLPDSSLDVVFRQSQASGTIRVTFVNEPLASVSSLGGSRSFDLGQRQVVANNGASAGSYSISFPVTLKTVVIRIGSDTVFTRAGSDIRTVGRMDRRGSFTLSLSPAEWNAMTTYRIR